MQAQAAKGGKGTPKLWKGALKVVAAEALEESKLLKTTEDFEDDTDNEGTVTKSGSGSLGGGGRSRRR